MYCETIPHAIEVLIDAGALTEEEWWDAYEAAPSGTSVREVEDAVLVDVLRELADDAERDAARLPGSWTLYEAFFSDGQPDEAQERASYDADC
jgi:hypothetical protein